jgi:hypothetical protein
MTLTRLMWLFAGLFVAFGLALGLSEDAAQRNLWGGLSVGCLGGFGLCLAADGVAKGEVRFGFDVVRRAQNPILFAAAITVIACAGLGTLVAAVWLWFFKPVSG